jgi:hypothetical protein
MFAPQFLADKSERIVNFGFLRFGAANLPPTEN